MHQCGTTANLVLQYKITDAVIVKNILYFSIDTEYTNVKYKKN